MPVPTPTGIPGDDGGGGAPIQGPGDGPENDGLDDDLDSVDHDDDPDSPELPASWAFGPVTLHTTFYAYETAVPVSQTWSGYVCGDPFTSEWHLTQVIESSGQSNTQQLSSTAFPMDSQPVNYGGYPLIEPLAGTEPDEPPFRFYVGDSQPESFQPTSQRIEAPVRWSPESCGG